MEIKHYTLYQGLKKDIPFTFVRIGHKAFYFKRQEFNFLKRTCIIALTCGCLFATI